MLENARSLLDSRADSQRTEEVHDHDILRERLTRRSGGPLHRLTAVPVRWAGHAARPRPVRHAAHGCHPRHRADHRPPISAPWISPVRGWSPRAAPFPTPHRGGHRDVPRASSSAATPISCSIWSAVCFSSLAAYVGNCVRARLPRLLLWSRSRLI